jgi:hypothetical protein
MKPFTKAEIIARLIASRDVAQQIRYAEMLYIKAQQDYIVAEMVALKAKQQTEAA